VSPGAGYSPRPLPDKLGYRAGQRILFIALPSELAGLARSTAFASMEVAEDWQRLAQLPPRAFDTIHAFATRTADLNAHLGALRRAIAVNGAIWISWPKKAARTSSDLTEDGVRRAALPLDLVDVKVAAIDAVWSGLKLVIRKDRR
jgi:hypothetical protein